MGRQRAAPALGIAVVRRDHLFFAPQVHNQGLATSISILVKPMGQKGRELPSQVAGGYTSGRRAGGAPVRKPTFRATPRGRRPGEWQQFTVSVPGRCGTVYTAPRDVFPILHCESSSGASRGAPERHVYCCWLRVRNGLFFTRNQAYYTRTPSGGTLGACATRQGGVGGGRASSPERLAARSRGVKRVALRHSRAGGMAVGRSRL